MAKRALWSWLGGNRESQVDVSTEMVLADVLSRFDVVEVVPGNESHDSYMVVTDRGVGPRDPEVGAVSFAETAAVDFRELGNSSPSPFTSFMRTEYNVALRGTRGLEKYDQMRRSDGTVRGTLRQLKTPVLGARWFIEPASDSDQDARIADFVWRALTEYMSISFTQVLTEALLMAEFGYYMFEKVFDVRIIKGEPRVVWQKMAPRHPMDVKDWHFDSNGGPRAVTMYSNGDWDTPDVTIPISKMLVFSFDREAGNIQGMSVLRSAYKHWYYKDQLYKIDAIQKERHGIGIPVIKLPMGFTVADKNAADELGRNLRTNERAHVVLPPNWDLIFAKLEGQPVNALDSIEHHDMKIRSNILADYVGEDATAAKIGHELFLKATRFIADIVCDDFNLYAIPQLVDYNYSRLPNGYPKLRARRIGETEDQRTLSFTVRNMVGAGIIEPDDKLEAFIRRELDLPLKDEATSRQIVVDHNDDVEEEEERQPQRQRGQRAGLPRQQSTPPVRTPRSNAGTDRSGR